MVYELYFSKADIKEKKDSKKLQKQDDLIKTWVKVILTEEMFKSVWLEAQDWGSLGRALEKTSEDRGPPGRASLGDTGLGEELGPIGFPACS